MAGEDTVPAGRAGLECRGHSFMGGIDARVRTGVLFGDLSVGCVSGCSVLDLADGERKRNIVFRILLRFRGYGTGCWECLLLP